MTDELLKMLLSQGLLGALTAVLGVALYRRDNDLTTERAARIADSKATLERLLALQEGLLEAVNSLKDTADTLKDIQRDLSRK